MASKPFWFHEDDRAQIEFLPLEVWDFCRDQIAAILAHTADHLGLDGVGWSAMYRRPATPRRIFQLGLDAEQIAAVMPWRLHRTDRVLSGAWGEEGTELPRMAAYTTGRNAILVGWSQSRIVDELWFHRAAISRWQRAALAAAFHRLGQLRPLLLVDWRGEMVDLSDKEAIESYLDDTPSQAVATPAGDEPSPTECLHRFDQPMHPVISVAKTVGGPRRALLAGADGRCWSVTINDPTLQAAPEIVPVPFGLKEQGGEIEYCDLASERLLVFRERGGRDWHEVYDLRSGETLFSTPAEEAAVLSPDGRCLLICRSEGLAMADLQQPEASVVQTDLFAAPPAGSDDDVGKLAAQAVTFDSAFTAMTAAASDDNSELILAVGDYGFAIVAGLRIEPGREKPIAMPREPQMLSEGMVYDPVEIVDVVPNRFLTVRHGHGAALTRYDLKTGASEDCPPPFVRPERRYGCFRQVVVSGVSPALWVQTDVGPYYWGADTQPRWLYADVRNLIAMTDDCYIGLTTDGLELIRARF